MSMQQDRRQRMSAEEAEEFTQALADVFTGSWRLIWHAQRQGIPEALGMTTQQWVEKRLAQPVTKLAKRADRLAAYREMTEDAAKLQIKAPTQPELAAAVGVVDRTVRRDAKADKGPSQPAQEDGNGDQAADKGPVAAPRTEDETKTEGRKNRDRDAEAKRRDRDQREAAVEEIPPPDIREGFLSTALADVRDVDLIFTDPPYPKEHLSAWSELSLWASRALKPGAWLAAYSGQSHLPDVVRRLGEHLEYQWLGWIATPGPAVPLHHLPIQSTGKPLLLFSNGKLRRPFNSRAFQDVARADGRTRIHHTWQQDEAPAAYFIDALTERGEYVADPFLGSGAFGRVAVMLERRFVGCDSDQAALATARERLAA